MDLNKVMLIGNVVRDPEMRTTPNGQNVVQISIATNKTWIDKNTQEKKEKVEFHNLVGWRKTADIIGQYVRKGSKIYVEGGLQTRSWEDQNGGGKKYRTEIVIDQIIMLDRKTSDSGAVNNAEQPAPSTDNSQPGYEEKEISVDDIPF